MLRTSHRCLSSIQLIQNLTIGSKLSKNGKEARLGNMKQTKTYVATSQPEGFEVRKSAHQVEEHILVPRYFFPSCKTWKFASGCSMFSLSSKTCLPISFPSGCGCSCRACPSGTYSKQLVDDDGTTYICEACPAGTSGDETSQHFTELYGSKLLSKARFSI